MYNTSRKLSSPASPPDESQDATSMESELVSSLDEDISTNLMHVHIICRCDHSNALELFIWQYDTPTKCSTCVARDLGKRARPGGYLVKLEYVWDT